MTPQGNFYETLENKCSNARFKFLIIWLTDKATIPIGRSKIMKNTHRISRYMYPRNLILPGRFLWQFLQALMVREMIQCEINILKCLNIFKCYSGFRDRTKRMEATIVALSSFF
jgi:hypothetical protein